MTAIETAKRDFPHVDWDASLVRHNRVIQVAAFKDGEPIYVCSTNLEYAAKKDDMPDDIIVESVAKLVEAMRAKGLYPPA